ncbi:MAG: hypothetical protein V4724_40065 [Pseudomonadota bacterium]
MLSTAIYQAARPCLPVRAIGDESGAIVSMPLVAGHFSGRWHSVVLPASMNLMRPSPRDRKKMASIPD